MISFAIDMIRTIKYPLENHEYRWKVMVKVLIGINIFLAVYLIIIYVLLPFLHISFHEIYYDFFKEIELIALVIETFVMGYSLFIAFSGLIISTGLYKEVKKRIFRKYVSIVLIEVFIFVYYMRSEIHHYIWK